MGLMKEHRRFSRHVTRGPRWRALRMAVLERDKFRCRECGAGGRLEVDHIVPVRHRPELAHDPKNLQALCPACHTRKTRLECGHPEPDENRQAWRQAVSDLEAKPKSSNGETRCLIL